MNAQTTPKNRPAKTHALVTLETTMKAAMTPNYGPAEVLEIREVPTPVVGPNEVLVEVCATPVTEGDRRLRSADFPSISVVPGRLMMGVLRPRNPVQGSMFAGRVTKVGQAVSRYAVGDDVFGSVDHGAYAEFVVVGEEGAMAKIPAGVSYEEAADLPYGAITALVFLRDLTSVKAGDRVLILGASGGVGRYAVQLARHLGAHVTGVASAANESLVRRLGADEFIDYRSEDWRENGEKYDVIFDIADTSSYGEARRSLTTDGRYATLFVSPSIIWAMMSSSLFGGPGAKFGIAMGSRDDMEIVRDLLEHGVLRPTVARTFEFDEIAEAHASAEALRNGTVMITTKSAAGLRAVA